MNFSRRSSLLIALFTTVLQARSAAVAQGVVRPPILNPANGHYYSVVTGRGRTFPAALADAATMSHLGIPGHLSTITSEAEQDFLVAKFPIGEKLWIAASDAAVEGEWRWVAGPETGQLFWLGGPDGTAFGYESWRRDRGVLEEPNNVAFGLFGPGEDYAAVYLSSSISTFWNDEADPPHGNYPVEYILEFSTVPEPSAWAMIAFACLAGRRALRGRLRPAQ